MPRTDRAPDTRFSSACRLWLGHLPQNIESAVVASALLELKDFFRDLAAGEHDRALSWINGWTTESSKEATLKLWVIVQRRLAALDFKMIAAQQLASSTNRRELVTSALLVERLRLDLWREVFARVQDGSLEPHFLTEPDSPERVRQLFVYKAKNMHRLEAEILADSLLCRLYNWERNVVRQDFQQVKGRWSEADELLAAGLKSPISEFRRFALQEITRYPGQALSRQCTRLLRDLKTREDSPQNRELLRNIFRSLDNRPLPFWRWGGGK